MINVYKMTSRTLLSSRLISLLKNGQWERDDVVKLFIALVKQFNDKKEEEDFDTWIMKILYKVEIHKIKVSDLTYPNSDQFVDHVYATINDIIKQNKEKTLDEIVQEICEQTNIDKQVMAEVKNIVSSVSKCPPYSTPTHLQEIEQMLFMLCKAVEKTNKMKPRLTQMVSWCLLVLSKSSQLVQVGTGEGKSCIVAMFAAYQALKGKTPDIISSSPVLAARDAMEWSNFYKTLNVTVDVNTYATVKDLKKCYECQVVYGTAESFAGDYLKQRFHRMDVRPKREFQCVIVDEVDSLMLDKGLEVVYINTEVPLMEQLNGILATIWHIVSQLKRLDTGEILGPIQKFSQILIESFPENANVNQLIATNVQLAVNAGILSTSSSIQKQENVENILKQLDNGSVNQIEAFLIMFVKNVPECVFQLYLQGPDGNLLKQNEISSSATNTIKEISYLLLESGQCRYVYFEKDLICSLERMIKKRYLSAKKLNGSCIPGLQDLIDGNLQTWIENALKAMKMTLDDEYILHGDGVAPVDFRCTGVVQNNMRWGEGLQQFLEIKHQTKLSNMSLITNFMSNVRLFKMYKNHIYGITGTLGDGTELDMLKKLYDGIETCKIPSFRCRKLYELEGLVIPKKEEWVQKVCEVVKEQVSSTVYRSPRAALVICETINHAKDLHSALVDTILNGKLKLYINNNMDNSTIVNKTVQEGDVIIATNLAGRGTDLKVCESVNEAGGLFVVQTFLPLNVRVEQQAFGRTARQGCPGSAQLIMCCSHFSESVKLIMDLNTSHNSLFSCLDSLATISELSADSLFERAVSCYQEIPSSLNHDIMISALTALLTLKSVAGVTSNLDETKDARKILVNIRLSSFLEKDIPKITRKEELFSVYLDVLDNIYEEYCFSEQRDVIVSSLHECWGLWLLMNFSEEKSIDTLKHQLMVDLSNAKEKLLSKQTPSSMVYYYIRSGNNLHQNGHLAESIEMYTKAVEDGNNGEIIPHYNRALATLAKKDAGYVAQALADLEKTDKAIDSYKLYMAHVLSFVMSSQDPKGKEDTLLTKQFQVKAMVLDLLKMNIQDAVMKLRTAERTGRDVRLTTKHVIFLIEHGICVPRVLRELLMELVNFISLGLDTIFSLDTLFSFSGFLSKIFFSHR